MAARWCSGNSGSPMADWMADSVGIGDDGVRQGRGRVVGEW